MMEIRHLRAAVVLADELHFGRTAKRLRVAQSAVSQMIKALEADIGATLFARTRRSVALTPAGTHVVGAARRMLGELDQLAAEARQAASGETGHLHLRFIATSVLTDVPLAVARFRRRYPAVSVRIEPGSSVEQLEAIRAGRCDVGFLSLATAKIDLAPLAFRVVATSPMVALMPARHRLARRRGVQLRDLAAEPFVFLAQTDEPDIHTFFRRRCLAAGFEPMVAVQVQHTDALLAFVAAGFGVSCAPGFVGRLHHRGVVAVPLRPGFHAGIVAIWHPARIAATGLRFLEMLPAVGRGGTSGTGGPPGS